MVVFLISKVIGELYAILGNPSWYQVYVYTPLLVQECKLLYVVTLQEYIITQLNVVFNNLII